MYYSGKTGNFYDRAIHGDAIPEDAVEITTEEWSALLDGQSSGKIIVAGKGGKPELQDPPQPAPVVPQSVTMRQARLALLSAGYLDRVQEAFDNMPGDIARAAKIEWDYAGHVERNSVFTQQMAAILSLDETSLDALFTAASQM